MNIVGVVIKDSANKIFKRERPNRHTDLIMDMSDFYADLRYDEMPKIIFQGFYTDDDRLLSREEAYIFARQNGQTQVTRSSGRLYSEDLW